MNPVGLARFGHRSKRQDNVLAVALGQPRQLTDNSRPVRQRPGAKIGTRGQKASQYYAYGGRRSNFLHDVSSLRIDLTPEHTMYDIRFLLPFGNQRSQ